MRFYKINSTGPLFINRGAAPPAHVPADEGRIFYDSVSYGGEVVFADAAAWIRMYSENNLAQLIVDIDATGAWIRKDQNDTTAFRLTVSDGVIGDIRATDGTLVLENGTNGTNATFEGNIHSDNGVACLVKGATPAASTYLGTADHAKYS